MSESTRPFRMRDHTEEDEEDMGHTLGTECVVAFFAARVWPLGTSMYTPEEKHLVVFNLIQSIMM